MGKSDFDYDVKKKWHEVVKSSIQEYVGSKDSSGLEVACLPGLEALEVRKIYDELDIPRKNITAIEYDKKFAKKIEKYGFGEIANTSFLDYFKNTDKTFDIISIDPYGQFTYDAWRTFYHIFTKDILKPKSVLVTNFYAARESNSVKTVYDLFNKAELNLMKKDSAIHNTINDFNDQSYADDDFKKAYQKFKSHNEIKNKLNGKMDAKLSDKRDVVIGEAIANLSSKMTIPKDIMTGEASVCAGITGVGIFLYLKVLDPYFIDNHTVCKYISDDRSPFISNIFSFSKKPELFANYYVKWLEKKHKMPKRKAAKKLLRLTDQTAKIIDLLYYPNLNNNIIDLGSSYKPKLTKEKAYELLEGCVPEEEIRKQYRVDNRKFAAWKAWDTMRKKEGEVEA